MEALPLVYASSRYHFITWEADIGGHPCERCIFYSPAMPFAIRQQLRHLFPRPHPIHIVEPHDPALLLRQRVQPAFRLLARLREFERLLGGAALIVHQFRDDPRHLVMFVRTSRHAGEDRRQPFRPGAQHLGLFIQPPYLLAHGAQAAKLAKGQVASPLPLGHHLGVVPDQLALCPIFLTRGVPRQ